MVARAKTPTRTSWRSVRKETNHSGAVIVGMISVERCSRTQRMLSFGYSKRLRNLRRCCAKQKTTQHAPARTPKSPSCGHGGRSYQVGKTPLALTMGNGRESVADTLRSDEEDGLHLPWLSCSLPARPRQRVPKGPMARTEGGGFQDRILEAEFSSRV